MISLIRRQSQIHKELFRCPKPLHPLEGTGQSGGNYKPVGGSAKGVNLLPVECQKLPGRPEFVQILPLTDQRLLHLSDDPLMYIFKTAAPLINVGSDLMKLSLPDRALPMLLSPWDSPPVSISQPCLKGSQAGRPEAGLRLRLPSVSGQSRNLLFINFRFDVSIGQTTNPTVQTRVNFHPYGFCIIIKYL